LLPLKAFGQTAWTTTALMKKAPQAR